MRSYRAPALALLVVVAMYTATSSHAQSFSAVYHFGNHSGDPEIPTLGMLAQGRDGDLYSTTYRGGAHGAGAVFKITPGGKLTTLYSFCSQANCADGAYPYGGLTLGTDGDLYGTTTGGGNPLQSCISNAGCGTIFKITSSGVFTVLYRFMNGTDGASPEAPPVQGTDGNFYGTAEAGGTIGCGTIYRLTSAGALTALYAFDETHGCAPSAPLALGTDGDFYSTAFLGGSSYGGGLPGFGTIFKVTPGGKLTVLHNFDGTEGAYSYSPLVQGTDGNFYGTTANGGSGSADGVVFKITPGGAFTVVYEMNPATDGYQIDAGLVQASNGKFYGAASALSQESCGAGGCGTLFKIDPAGSYLDIFTLLYTFDTTGASDPQVTPFQHTNGAIYGGTSSGGVVTSSCGLGCGVVYRLYDNLSPFVTLLPYSGKVGSTIEFLGQGFTSATTVSFNGTPATVTSWSGTYLTAIVPAGATTGTVHVTTGVHTLKSNRQFRVTP